MKTLNKQINKEVLTDKAANGIAKGILKSQNGFAKYMQLLSKNWKGKHQWIFLYFVCLIFGGLSIVAIVHPFRVKDANSSLIPKSHCCSKKYPSTKKWFCNYRKRVSASTGV